METHPTEPLSLRIHQAARDGLSMTLYATLAERSAPEQAQLLATLTKEDEQITTPLIIAARNGHEKTVHMLLSKFSPDLGQTGTVKFCHHLIEGASALWCAAGAGNLQIVKDLVAAGADVNQTTKVKSTPLRAACFEGRLDIVQFLLEHGANLHIANEYNNSCLMIAAYKGHIDIVRHLLEKGADPNVAANCGATALHFSAECGFIEIVRELINNGAKNMQRECGMTPLLSAAERCQATVVEYILTRPEITRLERITALELLGASLANDRDHFDLDKAYQYLKRAMLERCTESQDFISKPDMKPIEAYDNCIESKSLEDLESKQNNNLALIMESLQIRERILGQANPDLLQPVIYRGAVFADSADFDRCLKLWMHALRLRIKNSLSAKRDILRFAQVFSQILHVGVQLPAGCLINVLDAACVELERNLQTLEQPGPKDDVVVIQSELEGNMNSFLYLLVIFTKQQTKLSKEEIFTVMQVVHKVVKLRLKTQMGVTLLHLAVNSETPVDDFHTKDIVHFPNAAVTKLLLEAGADAGAMDVNRNTPLHLIVSYQRIVSDFITIHSIITNLIEAGAHCDAVNSHGMTPLQAATTGVSEIILKSQLKISLKCLAAQAIAKNNLKYQGQVPKLLETFIKLHGT